MEKGMMIKNFREEVLEIKKDIEDKEFFVSSQSHAYLQNLSEALTKRFCDPISISLLWGNPTDFVARANDRYQISLNVNNEYFNMVSDRINKLVILKALTIHECAHILFTDFHLGKSSNKVFCENRKLFPEPKCEEYKEWMTDIAMMDEATILEWQKIYHNLDNAIEDGFIEQMALKTIPGEGQCLYHLRKLQQDDFDSIKVQRNNGLSNEAILFNCILSLAKYGTVKMDPDDKDDEAIKALLANFNLIKAATSAQKSYDRKKLVNEIFCKLYKYMKEEQKKEDNDTNGESSDDQSNTQDSGNKSQSNAQKNSENQEGQGSNEGHDQQNQDSASQPENQSDETNTSDGNSANDGDNCDNSGQGNSNQTPSPSSITENMVQSGINDQLDTGTGSVLNDNNIVPEDTPMAHNASEKLDSMQNDKQPEAKLPSPEDMRAMDTIEEQIARAKLDKALEDKLKEDLKEEVKTFDFGKYNRNVDISIVRKDPTTNAEKIYEEDMKIIGFLVKRLVNEIRNKIKDHQQGGKINGLYQGRYLDQHSLSRFDLRCLCKNDLPEDIPNMAIGILIDGSGSMNSDGKIGHARRTALLLYLFGRELNIPVMVYSHNSYGTVTMTDLADYNSVDGNDRYRICDISASGCNRDGAALRFCSEKLAKRPEETKIMFVISDGRPSDYNNSAEADADIKGVLMDYAKKHVKYIAVGLGSDQDKIEALYTQGLSPKVAAKYLRTDNPSELPTTIIRAIKELIKV